MIPGIQLVGGDSEAFQRFLEETDPCFGKHFARSAPECQQCLCPIVVEGKVVLLREACEALCRGSTQAGVLKRLTSRQVLDALTTGKTVQQIWQEILNGCDPKVKGREARTLLKERIYYLENNRGMPPVTVPRFEDLVDG